MYKKLFLMSIFLSFHMISSLPSTKINNSNDLCYLDETKVNEECPDTKYTHKCQLKYCSTNKHVCNNFKNLNSLFKSSFRSNMLHINDFEKIKIINKSIKKCENNYNKSNSVCIKSTDCNVKQQQQTINVVVKGIDCQCKSKFKYVCSREFCSENKKQCDDFLANKLSTKTEPIKVPLCQDEIQMKNKKNS
jgi:hypothetical protein